MWSFAPEEFFLMGSIVLLDLMGGVALLLWGLHMVLSGVLRAFGPDLRRFLGKALRNRFTAFGAGLVLTALLQSSTATGLMTASLAADGVVSLVPALAIMLGANVGTTLIVQLLSFNISAVAPVLFVVGLVTFRAGGGSLTKALGRIAIGLGLTLLALHILLDTLAPAEQAPAVRALLAAITTDPVLCVMIAAALTWAAHSSVAVVLLVMSLAYSQFVTRRRRWRWCSAPISAARSIRCSRPASRGDPASRRLPVGNLINRLVGVLIALPFLQPIARELTALQPDAAKMTAEFHMLFNVALAAIFIGPLDAVAWLLVRLLPEKKQPADASVPRYLDEAALETPPLALANAARETLRMGDTIEAMLRDVMTALMNNDRKLASDVSRMDNVVDRLNEAIKLYITKLTRDSLDEREGRRAMEIVSFTINLEHIGDIIDKNLCELAAKKIKRRYQFSAEGAAELTAFHKRVCREPAGRLRHLHDRRRRGRAQAAARKVRAAQSRARSRRPAFRAAARRPAGKPGDDVAAPRHPQRPQAHPLAHLLGRLSGAGSRRRIAGARQRQERRGGGCAGLSAEAAVAVSRTRCSAKGAPLIRDRSELGVRNDPGSAAHHSASLDPALRPGTQRQQTELRRVDLRRAAEGRRDFGHETRHLVLDLIVRLQADIEIKDHFVEAGRLDLLQNFGDARRRTEQHGIFRQILRLHLAQPVDHVDEIAIARRRGFRIARAAPGSRIPCSSGSAARVARPPAPCCRQNG